MKVRYSMLSLLLVALMLPVAAFGQTAVVIEGGTLIDGNGGTPLADSVVIVQGNKITAVSRKGQVTYPANAQIIKADGKFVLPGLIDAHVHTWGTALKEAAKSAPEVTSAPVS